MIDYQNLHKENYSEEIKQIQELIPWIKGYIVKNNIYSAYIYQDANHKIKQPDWYRLFSINKQKINGDEFNVYLLIKPLQSIDMNDFLNYSENKWLIDYNNWKGVVWYNIEKNKIAEIDWNEALHMLVIWATWNWKWILMRSILYQLAKLPESEFLIVDKGNDFWMLKGTKKVRFAIDFNDVTNPPQRLVNFYNFLFNYSNLKYAKMKKYWFNDWRAYNKQRKKDIEEKGTTELELIPYTNVVLDEFQTLRVWLGDLEKLWDRALKRVIDICRASGMRLIFWTQDVQKKTLWDAVAGVQTRFFYKISYWSEIPGVTKFENKLINSEVFWKSYVCFNPNIWLFKPVFSDPSDMDRMIRDELNNTPDWYIENHASSVMELYASVADQVSDESEILSSYKKILKFFWFSQAELEKIKNSDDFITFISYSYWMFRFFNNKAIFNPSLDITQGIDLKSAIDQNIYEYLENLPTKNILYQSTKNTVIGKIPDEKDSARDNFKILVGGILRDYYNSKMVWLNSSDIDKLIDEDDSFEDNLTEQEQKGDEEEDFNQKIKQKEAFDWL